MASDLAISGKGQSGPYHISSGSDFAIKDLFNATIHALRIKLEQDVEVRPRGLDDVYTILLDPSKTLQVFSGWQVRTPLEQGVTAAIEWYKKFGISQTFTHLKPVDEKK